MEQRSTLEPGNHQNLATALGVLVIGTGFIADAHIAALRTRSDASLVGVVDIDPVRAANASRTNGGVAFTTHLAEALAWPSVDACIVCTPNWTHKQIAVAVATAGKHLLIEKPLATNIVDARAVAEAFSSAGVFLMAAHTHRFYDYARTVKAAIEDGAIGQPVLVRLAILGGWIWPDWRAWVLDPARSGGHALHNGVHLLDLVTWWIGSQPVSVYARGRKATSSELDIYDYLEMVVRYADGSTAVCEMSRGHRTGSLNLRDVLILGTEGTLTLPWDGDSAIVLAEQGVGLVPTAARDGFAVQLSAWIDAINGAAPAMSPAEAVNAVAMGVAAERSMVTGQPVELADLFEEVMA